MADEKKPSADEIVDNLAQEMGVADEKPEESRDDLTADLGGLFGVSSKKKKKKKKPEPVDEPVATAVVEEPAAASPGAAAISAAIEDSLDEASEPVKVATPVKKEKVAKPGKKAKPGIDGIFATGGDIGGPVPTHSYLDHDDLDGARAGGHKKAGLMAVIALLVVGIIGVVLATTPLGENLMLVFKGEYRAQRDAEIAAQEEAHLAAQKAALPKFGTLDISGSPKYATIMLNGEKKYGETSAGWREMQLNPGYSNFSNLSIKDKYTVEVSAPGFESKSFEITEGMWKGSGQGGYTYPLSVTLVPSSPFAQSEFEMRMAADTDNDYYGKMVLNSAPAGATVSFNGKTLFDEKGQVIKTPATIEQYFLKDDKEGSKTFGQLEKEPRLVRVDTLMDTGQKLVLAFPDQPDMPKWAEQVNRQLWTCKKKSDDEIAKLDKQLKQEHTLQHECDYVYTKTVDFKELKAYIERQEQERKRIEAYNKEIKEKRAALKGGAAPAPAEGDKAE